MSTSQKAVTPDFDRSRIDEIIKAAHRERNEAIGQLFGFGFTVVKDTISGLGRGIGNKADETHGSIAGSAKG